MPASRRFQRSGVIPIDIVRILQNVSGENGDQLGKIHRTATAEADHGVGFFILADEEPTINKKKFVAFCQELIDRKLDILWGINTRVTDILRDEELLPFYRKAGLIHVSLGTEAAAQLKLDLFNKETTIAQNKRAIELLRNAGIVVEAQFIVGLENETAETLEETYCRKVGVERIASRIAGKRYR